MNAEIIKLSDDEIEVDGVVYEKRGPRGLEKEIADWCDKVNREKTESINDVASYRPRGNGSREFLIIFKLPHANRTWTFEVFHYVKATVEHFERTGHGSYPVHSGGNMGPRELAVVVR